MDALKPGTSTDIVTVSYVEKVPYGEWLAQKQLEYESKSGPVSVRVDKDECERLLSEIRGRNNGYSADLNRSVCSSDIRQVPNVGKAAYIPMAEYKSNRN